MQNVAVIWPGADEVVDAQPVLQWEAFPEAAQYQVIIVDVVNYQVVLLDDDAYPPVVIADEKTEETTFAVTTALEPGSYSWTVWAKDANGTVIAEANNQFVVEK